MRRPGKPQEERRSIGRLAKGKQRISLQSDKSIIGVILHRCAAGVLGAGCCAVAGERLKFVECGVSHCSTDNAQLGSQKLAAAGKKKKKKTTWRHGSLLFRDGRASHFSVQDATQPTFPPAGGIITGPAIPPRLQIPTSQNLGHGGPSRIFIQPPLSHCLAYPVDGRNKVLQSRAGTKIAGTTTSLECADNGANIRLTRRIVLFPMNGTKGEEKKEIQYWARKCTLWIPAALATQGPPSIPSPSLARCNMRALWVGTGLSIWPRHNVEEGEILALPSKPLALCAIVHRAALHETRRTRARVRTRRRNRCGRHLT